MMRELDTVSPVVWPAWCYSGGQQDSEAGGVASADVLQPRPQPLPPSASSMATSSSSSSSSASVRPSAGSHLSGGASAHRKRRSVPRSYESPMTALNGARSSVKSERLSPHQVGDSASTSSLSRSGTPSSPPASSVGHPAGASPAASPSRSATSNNNNSTLNNNNISSHLKAMEDSVTHNYSEFMRNLAAKYQYVHPDEFYSATRNGFPAALDPRFPYKAGASPFLMPPLGPGVLPGVPGVPVPPGVVSPMVSPLHHLAAPVPPPPSSKDSARDSSARGSSASSLSSARDRDRDREEASNHSDPHHPHKPMAKSPPSHAASTASEQASHATSLLFSPLFSGALPAALPGALPGAVPGMDMSSTQALVNMVQRSHQNQLETYLKGAIKRPAETSPSPLSPLDLSSGAAAPAKKSRKSERGERGDLYGVDSLLGLPSSLIRSSKERLATRTPPSRALSSPRLPGTPPGAASAAAAGPGSPKSSALSCSALCSTTPGHASAEGPCGEGGATSIGHWSVGDVCNFVGSIDLCVEYVQAFRDQRIDGSALPLLTEEHLRVQMKMRLGPALKLRTVLAKRLGHCSVCLHCVHCHSLPSPASSTTTTAVPSPPRTPSSSSGSASGSASGSTTPVATASAGGAEVGGSAPSPKPASAASN